MTRHSFNPYHKLHSNLSPQSYKDLIINQQRRISEITAAIQQAENYLITHPGCEPVTWRLGAMRKDLSKAYIDLKRSERSLAELLERMKEIK